MRLKMINCGAPSYGGAIYGCIYCSELKFVSFCQIKKVRPGGLFFTTEKVSSPELTFLNPELAKGNIRADMRTVMKGTYSR